MSAPVTGPAPGSLDQLYPSAAKPAPSGAAAAPASPLASLYPTMQPGADGAPAAGKMGKGPPSPNPLDSVYPTMKAPAPDQAEPAGQQPGQQDQATAAAAETGEADAAAAQRAAELETAYPFLPEVPEGFTVDPRELTAARQVFADLGLSGDQATALFKLHVEQQHQAVAAFKQEVDAWRHQVETDPTIGGERLPATLRAVGLVMDRFSTPEFRLWLDSTGYGNHPAVVEFVRRIGVALGAR